MGILTDGIESTYKAGEPGLIPGSARSTPVFLAWRIPWTEEPGGATVHGVARVGHN